MTVTARTRALDHMDRTSRADSGPAWAQGHLIRCVATTSPDALGARGTGLRRVSGSASRWRDCGSTPESCFHYATEEILHLAQQGNVLIRGWGVATLLRDLGSSALRVCGHRRISAAHPDERLGAKDAM